ncbi:MAG: lipoyl synthase [Candidatus Obscuribacter sp.]|jgi:lipoic acid synthetase|nr:lipoyl synthase [Candidatus Obscuribacter sp.]MBK7838947.1 lipoyl synthase [Candidatus Obscuribacter sp.]MBK9205146.1 lipoyl synthase [Candidatus Obscuribacter sp.]MBK9619527.1 lipoyl synthase [Candidatus Obscuribacter sp.]MBL0185054.1 lipoyl synthase [Candidatus Obscuribacter sp.]
MTKSLSGSQSNRAKLLSHNYDAEEDNAPLRLPEWVKRSVLNTTENRETRLILKEQKLNTICESGRCPNKGECWAKGTATFMLMGSLCTRTCRFCAVNKGMPAPLEEDEPERIATAAAKMGLKHVVLTSVNRDDLPDQGANHFARTITAIKAAIPGVAVEVLTPDFQGRRDALEIVLAAYPVVYNHNVETVPRLYKRVRPGSKYDRSLKVLAMAKEITKDVPTKSGLMLGVGETFDEVREVMRDLRAIDCDFLTLGQYLRPTRDQLPVKRYVEPAEFDELAAYGWEIGFKMVHAGPLVRSSYHAEELASQL